MSVTGETIDEMMDALNMSFKAVEARIQRAKIKPITRRVLYPIGTTEAIRDVKMGRPKKVDKSN